jgi:hypothetical protein
MTTTQVRPQLLPALQLTVATAGLLTFGAFAYFANEAHKTHLAQLGALTQEVQRAHAPGRFLSLDEVANNCVSDKDSTSCTFTNLGSEPIFTCGQGVLQNKEVPALHLKSLVLCSGRLDPGETRTVDAPWVGGFADDICNKENSFGKILDFSKCTFQVEAAPLPGEKSP